MLGSRFKYCISCTLGSCLPVILCSSGRRDTSGVEFYLQIIFHSCKPHPIIPISSHCYSGCADTHFPFLCICINVFLTESHGVFWMYNLLILWSNFNSSLVINSIDGSPEGKCRRLRSLDKLKKKNSTL